MKRFLCIVLSVALLSSCNTFRSEEENEEYDNPMERELQEAEKIKDPALGYVPYQRLYDAINYTETLKNTNSRSIASLTWIERGPVYDSVGPSNGNRRGGGASSTGGYTAGRMRAFLLDTLNDPSGNTVFAGGVAGGVWRCTNFLSAIPNWVPVNDYFTNLAIASISQNPANPSILYFATGEATSNSDAVFGKGVWKSTDAGATFTLIPSTAAFTRSFKIDCDASGNVYLATRNNGFVRSTDNGNSWLSITPNDLTSGSACTDFEFTSSGKLNAAFGYFGTTVNHRYTNNPATVTTSGWLTGAGFRTSNTQAIRTEMAVLGETLYAVTVNSSRNADSCYKSVDGGQTWLLQNSTIMPSGVLSGQGWYNQTLAINPNNASELICGGLDAYRSSDDGQTWTRITYWVSTSPYVHADHHYLQYWIRNGETRLIMGTDGGLFYSNNNGATFIDKNRNLAIKQFYSVAIHPAAGSPYLLAGAQDNGTHQLKNDGLSYSTEVTGGDGMYVHINQQNPLIQFGSYVFNQYRRSTNGGLSWSSVNLSTSGLFVNPFTYDDAQNIMYASNGGNGQIRRWDNANTGSTSSVFSIAAIGGSTALSALHVSPNTANRVFLGTNNGRVVRLDNASTVTSGDIDANVTNITGASFPASGYVNCVNTGTDDNNLVAVFSNYGVNNVWVSTNGGTSWIAVDGNLPDMPVRWALYEPGRNDKLYLATEAGVYHTDLINGASTAWAPEVGFPTVRTDMLKMRISDSTIAAGTHGRGLFTAKIPSGCTAVTISSQPQNTNVCAGANTSFSISVNGSSPTYQWQLSTDGGTTFNNIAAATAATLNVTGVTIGMNNYQYRCVVSSPCAAPVTSGFGLLTVNPNVSVTTQPVNQTICTGSNVTFTVAATGLTLSYQWQVSTDAGATFSNIGGQTSPTLILTSVITGMNNYQYRCIIVSTCPASTNSNAAVLTVNTAVAVTAQPTQSTVCIGNNTGFSITASGTGLTYQWQVSTDGGTLYSNIAGATQATYNLTAVAMGLNNNLYRCVLNGDCNILNSNAALLRVNPLPLVQLNADPFLSLYPGLTTTIKTTVIAPLPVSFVWYRNNTLIPGATINSLTVNIDGLGEYKTMVTDANGCVNTSAVFRIADSVSNKLFVYPNPNAGLFQVRYYTAPNNLSAKTITMYDARGAVVYRKSYTLTGPYDQLSVNMNGYGKGMYLLELSDNTGKRIKTAKVIVY